MLSEHAHQKKKTFKFQKSAKKSYLPCLDTPQFLLCMPIGISL